MERTRGGPILSFWVELRQVGSLKWVEGAHLGLETPHPTGSLISGAPGRACSPGLSFMPTTGPRTVPQ